MATKSGELKPRPYARLLTMLSNQLIKNNTIALTELAKNSYDADANWVQIRIGNMAKFGKKGVNEKNKPFVEIEDDGEGMSFETIMDSWMNPASPNKFLRRQAGMITTKKNRIIQGEKGIGGYAVFQIGKKVEIYTRERMNQGRGGNEVYLVTDLSGYTDELISEKSDTSQGALFFDQLSSKYNIVDEPLYIKPGELNIEGNIERRKNYGTLIRITELNYGWSLSDVKKIREILSRLQSPFRKKDFAVSILFENEEVLVSEDFKIEDTLEGAPLKFIGSVDTNGICEYSLNEKEGVINLVENLRLDRIPANRNYFLNDNNRTRIPQCGPFQFKFYVYDLDKIEDSEFKRYLRTHRTYIYRDDIRVYPYGDSDNDWIKLDTYRGLAKAGYYLSNDQLIGYVSISLEENPGLRDKTNREGLLEQGTAYDDLRFLTLSALNFLHTEFQKLKLKPEIKAKHRLVRTSNLYLQTEKVGEGIDDFRNHLNKVADQEGKKLLTKLTEDYYKERNVYQRQIEIVEDLAGVGIAVDATSHDFMVVMDRAIEKANELQSIAKSKNTDTDRLTDKIEALNGQLIFMKSLLLGIQPLFRSSRRRNKELRIYDIIKTVERYYEAPLKRIKAHVNIREVGGAPLVVVSSEGALLQLFINLMDNSVYWLRLSNASEPGIEILIDGYNGSVIFADNGPGIRKEDIDYIFEPFFSTKGLQGRGLGLYIARQLADRYEYDLYYLEDNSKHILLGANFRIDFFEQG